MNQCQHILVNNFKKMKDDKNRFSIKGKFRNKLSLEKLTVKINYVNSIFEEQKNKIII